MRAGWRCSLCKRGTVGPSAETPEATTVIGKAAHITAASSGPGARRYDALKLPEERAGPSNAIWLCSDHADLIDRDESTYSVERLHAIKRDHEEATALAVRTGARADLLTGLVAIDPDLICTGKLTSVLAESWTLRLAHFLAGDMHGVVSFIDGFAEMKPEVRYVLSNELVDGRYCCAADPNKKRGWLQPALPDRTRLSTHRRTEAGKRHGATSRHWRSLP